MVWSGRFIMKLVLSVVCTALVSSAVSGRAQAPTAVPLSPQAAQLGQRCEDLEASGDRLGALQACRGALELAPQDAVLALLTGRVLARLGAAPSALDALADARRLDPAGPE